MPFFHRNSAKLTASVAGRPAVVQASPFPSAWFASPLTAVSIRPKSLTDGSGPLAQLNDLTLKLLSKRSAPGCEVNGQHLVKASST
jgi:hypothetical protein